VSPVLPSALDAAAEAMPALREAIGELHPDLAAVALYHRGWADADGTPTDGGGGKAVRAAIAVLAADAAGDRSAGIPAAVAVELVHDFSLLHDDVMDGDTERRHRPTAWTAFGVGPAVLAGDALLAKAFEALARSDRPAAPQAARRLVDAVAVLIDGQARDLALEGAQRPTVDDCLAMCAAKTGALLGAAPELGALLAGADDARVARLQAFGRHLGMAFQAVDDLLGIWGDPSVMGKPAYSDLRKRKRSLPVVAALAAPGGPADRLRDLLDAPGVDGDGLAAVAAAVEAAGGRRAATELARRELEAALTELDAAGAAAGPRAALAEIAAFVVEREL
jgi:geranylgeranyl diphosphate synthase, type I